MKSKIRLSRKYIIKNEAGATSIFVLIFMVVLLVFGVAALSTSLASLKLADKNHNWSSEYYRLEGVAQKQLADIDALLYKAEDNARDYVVNRAFLENSSNYIDKDNQESVFKYWLLQNDIKEQEDFLNQLIQYVYYHQVFSLMPSLSEEFNELSFDDWMKNPSDVWLPQIKYSVQEDKKAYPKNIDVVLNLVIPKYDFSVGINSDIKGLRDDGVIQRFEIVKWKEWQNSFTYTDDINFENPSFENPGYVNQESDTGNDGVFMEIQD